MTSVGGSRRRSSSGASSGEASGWRHQFGSVRKVFDEQDGRRSAQEERQQAELRRFKDVVAELTAENLELKKGLSG
jgi:hypothetical protein